MKQKIQPRGKYILVKSDIAEERENEFGLIVPDSVEKEQRAVGEVVAVGDVPDVKKGDRVVYGALAGEIIKTKIGAKETEYKLLHDEDVIAFIRE